jgi:hypothetical protein
MKIPTVAAVRCSQCGRLHGVNDNDYVILWGKLIVNTNAKTPLDLGDETAPTILCSSTICIQRLFRLIDDKTYKAMLAAPNKDYEDEDY